MKLIVRVDDLGFSEAVNCGIQKVAKDGIVTAIGMMANMPAASHGYNLVKEYQQINIGLHVNVCSGKPVAPVEQIPSLVDSQTGEFYSSSAIRERAEDTVSFEEACIEIEAQIQRFMEITKRKPDYIDGHAVKSKQLFIAVGYMAQKHDLFYAQLMNPNWVAETGIANAKWFTPDAQGLYDPIRYLLEDEAEILDKECAMVIFHPGYLDHEILTHSSFTTIRTLEAHALCSEQVKNWVQENQIELCHFGNYK